MSTRSWGSGAGPPSASARPPPTRPGRRGPCRSRGRRGGRAAPARAPGGGRRVGRLVLEVDDLDGAAGRQDDAADVVGVVGLAHGVIPEGLMGSTPYIGPRARGLESDSSYIRTDPQSLRCGYSSADLELRRHDHSHSSPGLGPLELAIILLIVLVIVGGKRLPQLGRQVGGGDEGVQGLRDQPRPTSTSTTTTPTRARRTALGRARPAGATRPRRWTARSCASAPSASRRRPRSSAMATRLKPIAHDDRLSLVEHLDELRTRIIICVVGVRSRRRHLPVAGGPDPRHGQQAARRRRQHEAVRRDARPARAGGLLAAVAEEGQRADRRRRRAALADAAGEDPGAARAGRRARRRPPRRPRPVTPQRLEEAPGHARRRRAADRDADRRGLRGAAASSCR